MGLSLVAVFSLGSFLFAVVVGIVLWLRFHRAPSEAKALVAELMTGPEDKTPVARLSAKDLCESWSGNPAKFERDYGGQWIELYGEIKAIRQSDAERYYIEPSISECEERHNIVVLLADESGYAELRRGQSFRCIGKCWLKTQKKHLVGEMELSRTFVVVDRSVLVTPAAGKPHPRPSR